jgi:pSer/pThr/pTyr-binding forkhead associated (FHA) protein
MPRHYDWRAVTPSGATPVELKAQIEAERGGVPFLVYRDAGGAQRIHVLEEGAAVRVTLGRAPATDVPLEWDEEVSRVHTELERISDAWTVVDDGLSRNGTFVNGERVTGRRRLRDGDVLRVGATALTFRTAAGGETGETVVAADAPAPASLSDAQRRVLVALCRPFRDESAYSAAPTNQAIAEELFLSVDAVKTHLRALFAKFEVEDLPQNRKRLELVRRALTSGAVTRREL